MMYEEDIQKINEWFDEHSEYFGTARSDREYSVDKYDLDCFTDFLRKEFPDLIGIRCYIGTGDANIWFFKDDLEHAKFY